MAITQIENEAFNICVDGPDAAPALLLSNSLSCDMTMWDEQVAQWKKHFRVIRYDQRGHGLSLASPGPYTIDQLGRDALAVLDNLDISQAHFCGLSLGGMVGMWLLTHAPKRIMRAVLANTSAHMGPPDLWNGRIEIARAGGTQATVEPTVTRWFPQPFHQRAPQTIDRMRVMIRGTSVKGYIASCEAIREMDQRDSISAITNPTLVIIGSNDPATTPQAGRFIHDAIVGASMVSLDAGHISNVEQPAAFTQAVQKFLLRIGDTTV